MKRDKNDKAQKDADLSAFFSAAQADPPQISADFLANLTQQAENVQIKPAKARGSAPVSLQAMFGGWLPSAGFASAALLGVWFGVNPPEMLDAVTAQIFGASNLDDLASVYDYDFAVLEGI